LDTGAAEACGSVYRTELVHDVVGPPLTLRGYDKHVLLPIM